MAKSETFPGLLSTDDKKKFVMQLSGMPNTATPESGVPTGPSGEAKLTYDPGVEQTVAPTSIKEFTFTPKYAQLDQANQRKIANADLTRQTQLKDLDQQYQMQVGDTQRQQDETLKAISNSMASRGLFRSGINAAEQGDAQSAYARYLDRLSQSRARGIQGIESGYAGALNDVNSARESMYFNQVQEEEAARLADLQRQEEARRAQEEATRLAELQAQERADAERRQQELLAQLQQQQVSYQPPAYYGVGYDPVGGGYSEPAPQAPPDDGKGANIVMPAFNNGVTRQAVEKWVNQNVDPWISGNVMNGVIQALTQAGPQGVRQADIAWLIDHLGKQGSSVSYKRPPRQGM